MRLREKWVLSAERAAEGGLLSYQNWFDKAASLEAVRSQACVDFFSKVMTPDVLARIGDPRDQAALEIGSGGGRLLGCAAQVFRRAVGVDIVYARPALAELTRELHRTWRVEGCELLEPSGLASLEAETFSFVYSFIVFQHFDSEQVVFDYLRAARRLTKQGGLIRIFMGRSASGDIVRLEGAPFDPDRLQFDSTLLMSPDAFTRIAEIAGLRVTRVVPQLRKQLWSDAPSSQMMFDLVRDDAL
jgi:hypothetical protein